MKAHRHTPMDTQRLIWYEHKLQHEGHLNLATEPVIQSVFIWTELQVDHSKGITLPTQQNLTAPALWCAIQVWHRIHIVQPSLSLLTWEISDCLQGSSTRYLTLSSIAVIWNIKVYTQSPIEMHEKDKMDVFVCQFATVLYTSILHPVLSLFHLN